MIEHKEGVHRGEDGPEFRFKVIKKCKTSLERQVREAVRIQLRGNVLNKKGTYNRCKLTRMVVDEEWDKKVWEEAWEPRPEREETGETLIAPNKSKRKEEEAGSRKKAKLEEGGKVWGEYKADDGMARSRFLNVGLDKMGGADGQSKILFHSGLEWCMREILKAAADLAVETSTACHIAREWQLWERECQSCQ